MMSDWISCMDNVEPLLLEVENRSRSRRFLPSSGAEAGQDEKDSDSEGREESGYCEGEKDNKWKLQHRRPHWASRKLVLTKENPFDLLKVTSGQVLDQQVGRQPCSACCKPRKYFCYSCLLPLPSLAPHLPRLHLPLKLDVVKHRQEVEGKSTAVHAAILAPGSVRMFVYPDIPDYNPTNTLLVFPGPESVALDQLVQGGKGEVEEVFPFERVLFIDSTWNQCHAICEDERIKNLPKVIIQSRNTMFWRYQAGKPKEYLATIEAIYYFNVDFHRLVLKKKYKGEYDNLLFFFKFMYEKIHQLYDSQTDS